MGYFSYSEFACSCGDCEEDGTRIDPILLTKLNAIRTDVGHPMYITSGIRCPKFNSKCGGARYSFHLSGKAADISCSDSLQRYGIVQSALKHKLTIGVNKTFVHVDVRDKPIFFTY